jgi:hypothetical protein
MKEMPAHMVCDKGGARQRFSTRNLRNARRRAARQRQGRAGQTGQ